MSLPRRFTVEPLWTGCTSVILAGGPSLSLKQIRAIAMARMREASPFRVIAVNDAIYPAWFADWHHACDREWWYHHIQTVHQFPGIKTTLADDVPEPWVTGYLENSGCEGFDPDPSRCRTGANSAYQAMHISIHAGVRKIILVGVDMKASGADHHWFGDHPKVITPLNADYQHTMVPHFETLKPALAERGIEVVNASPGSALAAFPLVNLEEALNHG